MTTLEQDMVIIEHQPSSCKSEDMDTFTVCTYKLYAAGNDDKETSKYHIQATRTEASMLLVEGDATRNQVDKAQCQYYKFYVSEATDITSVTFLTTTINGNVDMFASRTIENPDSKSQDKVSWAGRLPITFEAGEGEDQEDLTGSYFISVCGYDTSYYTVLTTVDRDKKDDNDTVVITPSTLDQNIPQHVFIEEQEIQYFTFNINLTDEKKKDINIILTPLKG